MVLLLIHNIKKDFITIERRVSRDNRGKEEKGKNPFVSVIFLLRYIFSTAGASISTALGPYFHHSVYYFHRFGIPVPPVERD